MFTGIITDIGTVEARLGSRLSISVDKNFLRRLKRGDSVAVEGACLTIVGKSSSIFSADVIPETSERTTLKMLKRGAKVNLELPATPKTFLSGHIIQGHVDCLGTLKALPRKGNSRILKIAIPRALITYVVEKGSIAMNGVALTVVEVGKDYVTVGIIPYTWENTSLNALKIGARVNIELDVLAKYVKKFV